MRKGICQPPPAPLRALRPWLRCWPRRRPWSPRSWTACPASAPPSACRGVWGPHQAYEKEVRTCKVQMSCTAERWTATPSRMYLQAGPVSAEMLSSGATAIFSHSGESMRTSGTTPCLFHALPCVWRVWADWAAWAHLQAVPVLELRQVLSEVALQRLSAPAELQLLLLAHGRQLLQRALRMRLHACDLCAGRQRLCRSAPLFKPLLGPSADADWEWHMCWQDGSVAASDQPHLSTAAEFIQHGLCMQYNVSETLCSCIAHSTRYACSASIQSPAAEYSYC